MSTNKSCNNTEQLKMKKVPGYILVYKSNGITVQEDYFLNHEDGGTVAGGGGVTCQPEFRFIS